MSYDALKIMSSAYEFASCKVMDETKSEPLTEEKVLTLRSESVLGTKYGKTIAENLILGAIMEYHNQLRQALLQNGIEISSFDL